MSDESHLNTFHYAVTSEEVARGLATVLEASATTLRAIPDIFPYQPQLRAFARFILSQLGNDIEDAFVRLGELSPIGETTDNGKAGDQ
jgi:hypothetical protein